MKQPLIQPGRRGLLHSKLGVPQSKPIPQGKLAAAKKSPSPALRKEATFAENAKGWKRPSGQFSGQRERDGKANGGGYAEAQHPQSHDEFESLGK
jgi:hypothetical protein